MNSVKYNPTIRNVEPPNAKNKILDYSHCYIGVSLRNSQFYGHQFQAIINWVENNYSNCRIIVGDYLERYNYMIFEGISEDEAGQQAQEDGRKFFESNVPVLKTLNQDVFHLERSHSFLSDSLFREYYKKINALYQAGGDFSSSIERTTRAFIRRNAKRGKTPAVTQQRAESLSVSYLLEELGIYATLVSEGWKVEVYPGPELEILALCARGEIPKAPTPLKDHIGIELNIQPQ